MRHIKAYILGVSFLVSLFCYWVVSHSIASAGLANIRLAEVYGFTTLIYLYFTLLPGPLYRLFPDLIGKAAYRSLLSGLGIATFYFALLHASVAFFKLLLGFEGLGFLSPLYLTAVTCGFGALLILALMAGTSFDWMKERMGKYWKILHRFVYAAGILVLLHIVTIGTHFRDFSNPISLIALAAIAFILILYALTTYRMLTAKFPRVPTYIISIAVSISFFLLFYILYFIHSSLHAAHLH